MNYTVIIIFIIVLTIVIAGALKLSSYYSTLKDVQNAYGVDPDNRYDDRAYQMMSSYFNLQPISKEEQLDSQTWKDLQMSILFSQLDHTKSHIGSEFMYRYMRDQRDKDLDRFERDVQYFSTHSKERDQLLYYFEKMKAVDGLQFIDHLKNSQFFPELNTRKVKLLGLLSVLGFLAIPLAFIVPEFGLVAVFGNLALLFINQTQYMINFKLTQRQWDLFYVLSYMLDSVKQLLKYTDPVFQETQTECTNAYKNVNSRIRKYSILSRLSLIKYSVLGICPFLSWHFGIYGWVYEKAVKLFKENSDDLLILYETIGYYEMVIGHASYRETLQTVSHPTFDDIDGFDFEDMVHPLIEHPVANSKYLSSRFLITGANASGKTTFARTLLLNIYLSQHLNICFAQKLRFKKAKLYSSIAIEDDLMQGDSFYMVEIKRLKYFLDIARSGQPAIFFLDEILKGTNTKERIAASSTILEYITNYNCSIGLTTHDTELSDLLSRWYQNYHFKEETSDGTMHYDYLIYDGATRGSNAITLLEHCGYDEEIIKEAKLRAELFEETGRYK